MNRSWQDFKLKDPQEREAFIIINSINGIGRKTINNLISCRIKSKVSFGQILGKSVPKIYKKCLSDSKINSIKNYLLEEKKYSIIEQLMKLDIHAVTVFDDVYPRLLKEIDDPPLVFYYRGDIKLLSQETWVAMVGTRRMTAYGNQAAKYLVNDFVMIDWGIVSGCMYGIDAASHQACLDAGGKTIGVLGYGFGYKSLRDALRLEDQILEKGGGLITEFAPFTPAQASHFPLRNRIVAGLSQAVIVIEAAEKSGSHITAQCALDAGRLVAAVPGPITSPYSQGTKSLINQGAICISSASDVLSELGSYTGNTDVSDGIKNNDQVKKTIKIIFPPNSLEYEIYDMLRNAPCSTQSLAEQATKSATEVMASLTNLEIAGIIDRTDTMWRIVI